MSRSLGVAAAASTVAVLIALAGCAPTDSIGTPDDVTEVDTPAATGDFCTEFEANGGTGATIGPVQTWLPKEDVVADVQGRLDAMGDIEAPADIAAEWDTMKTYYTDLLAAAEALPAGGTLNDPTLTGAPDEYQAVVDYFFETC